ncbi:hypothetical protein LguiA_005900 [Lonicera macranthoides]
MAPILTTFTFSLVLFFLQHIYVYSLTQPTGFTVDLIHREYSPLSPFYNPALSEFDRLHNTVHRSFSRVSNTIQSQITSVHGVYLMNISIGTPPFTILGIADTGSDLTWTQCQPCTKCFKQKSTLFDPRNSSTYKNITCNSRTCKAFQSSSCGPHTNFCQYGYLYADFSFTFGNLAVDSFTFRSTSGHPVSTSNIVFGCGHHNGRFQNYTSGIIGLGRGPFSIINQLKGLTKGKFSYCLVPLSHEGSKPSKINFGRNAVVSGTGVVSTPLRTKFKSQSTIYYVHLERITVGDRTFEYKGSSSSSVDAGKEDVKANFIIDSGTTLTYIPNEMYNHLESKVKESVSEEPIKYSFLRLCYKKVEGWDRNVPNVTFHFTGADVDLPPSVTFLEMKKGLACLMILPDNEFPTLGSLSQVNLLVGYDLVKKRVSFKRADCTKH